MVDAGQLLGLIAMLRRAEAEVEAAKEQRRVLFRSRPQSCESQSVKLQTSLHSASSVGSDSKNFVIQDQVFHGCD